MGGVGSAIATGISTVAPIVKGALDTFNVVKDVGVGVVNTIGNMMGGGS